MVFIRVLVALMTLANVSVAVCDPVSRWPDGFVDVADIVPEIQLDLRYVGANNFLGTPVDGYQSNRLILTETAALALREVQAELKRFGFGLRVFDGYRPQRAVDHFVRWSSDLSDITWKQEYYPDVEKSELFKQGYIASHSSHSRGSTVDLTIVDLRYGLPGTALDMGSRFDYFGPESSPQYRHLSASQRANRMLLQTVMIKYGFSPYPQEWWHFTFKDEPYPEQYFDFPIL